MRKGIRVERDDAGRPGGVQRESASCPRCTEERTSRWGVKLRVAIQSMKNSPDPETAAFCALEYRADYHERPADQHHGIEQRGVQVDGHAVDQGLGEESAGKGDDA